MADLMTIGEFAAATWLSPKALRLYDRNGLLSPDAVAVSYTHLTLPTILLV